MKQYINKIFLLLTATALFTACQKEEERAILNSSAMPVLQVSSQNVILLKDNADKDALTLSWLKPDFGFAAGTAYTILIDKKGGDFSKGTSISMGTDLTKTMKVSELNKLITGMGIVPGATADIDLKVQSLLGTATNLNSAISTIKVATYVDKLDLSTIWGVVGSAANNWGATPDLPFYKSATPNELVAYVTLIEGEIKFRQNNDWVINLGGSNGTLKAGGDNIAVKAGTYRITFNPTASTYKIEKFSWGVVGSAYNNWGASPDFNLTYDPTVDYWRGVVTLLDGEMKIRANNDWGTNFGGSNGTLKDGGDNIAVKKGTYLITVDFKNLKYTIKPYAPWGIVGAATITGWGDKPDQKFTYDLSTETWMIKGIILKNDQFKFRLNDDWGTNFGTTAAAATAIGTTGGLKAGGENFIAVAGTYDFELDLKDPAKPIYKATKVK